MSQSTALANQFKPAILQCFGDIASAIGGAFEKYLSVVAQVLQQAATVQASPDGSYEMFDYVISLREGIMDAWGGIIGAMKSSDQSKALLNPNRTTFMLIDLKVHCYSRVFSQSFLSSTLSGLITTRVKLFYGQPWASLGTYNHSKAVKCLTDQFVGILRRPSLMASTRSIIVRIG